MANDRGLARSLTAVALRQYLGNLGDNLGFETHSHELAVLWPKFRLSHYQLAKLGLLGKPLLVLAAPLATSKEREAPPRRCSPEARSVRWGTLLLTHL